jgi:hypothetical protein
VHGVLEPHRWRRAGISISLMVSDRVRSTIQHRSLENITSISFSAPVRTALQQPPAAPHPRPGRSPPTTPPANDERDEHGATARPARWAAPRVSAGRVSCAAFLARTGLHRTRPCSNRLCPNRSTQDPASTDPRRAHQRVRTRGLKPLLRGNGRVLEPDRAAIPSRACHTPPTTTPRGRIGHCRCGRRDRHHRSPSRFMAGSGVDPSWADSSTTTRRQPETAGQAPWPRSGTPQQSSGVRRFSRLLPLNQSLTGAPGGKCWSIHADPAANHP